MKRKRINPISTNRRRVGAIYRRLRRLFLAEHPKCEVSGEPATDVHHSRGRAGTLYIDVRFWKAVSREAHNLITKDVPEARARGLTAPLGQWNVPPKDAETERLKDLMR